MVRLTLIARITDGLPLAEGLDSEKDNEIDQYKAQAKVCTSPAPSQLPPQAPSAQERYTEPPRSGAGGGTAPLLCAQSLFKRLGQASLSGQAQKMSVDAGKYMFHYVLDSGAVFLTLAERG